MTAGIQPEPSFAAYLRDITSALSRDELECSTFVDASLGARLALKDPNLSVAQVAKVVAGALDEPAAHALLAEHFDEVTWLLAAVRG